MEGYEDRLVDEHAALQENTEKLEKFIASKPYSEVSLQDQSYLEDQLKCQKALLRVLTSRMEIAKNKDEAAKAEKAKTEKKVEPIKK
jgi:uncharacterized membrane protein YfhO